MTSARKRKGPVEVVFEKGDLRVVDIGSQWVVEVQTKKGARVAGYCGSRLGVRHVITVLEGVGPTADESAIIDALPRGHPGDGR